MSANSKKFYMHLAISIVLFVLLRFVPASNGLTPIGVNVLSVFIPVLYMWLVIGTDWPSWLAMALVSRIAEFDRKLRLGDWDNENPFWKSLFNMRVGLVGYGHIGREIHRLLLANEIETYTIDRGKTYARIKTVPSLEALCEACDLLFLSLPRTAATDKLFNAAMFARMQGKFLVNVGRSNCIDEGALYEALTKGGMAGAAIDTWREKPRTPTQTLIPFDHPFQTLDNILLSSHKAMQLIDGHARYVADILSKVIRYLKGEMPGDAVDCTRGY